MFRRKDQHTDVGTTQGVIDKQASKQKEAHRFRASRCTRDSSISI
nr:hypothetical protein [Staphylococcus sp. GDY8P64P]